MHSVYRGGAGEGHALRSTAGMRLLWIGSLVAMGSTSACFSLLTTTDGLSGPDRSDAGGGVVPAEAGALPDAAPGSDPTLHARWSFEEDAGILTFDTSGHGYDGKLNAGAFRTQGISGNAIRFDRAAGGNVIAPIGGFGSSSFTFAAWVKSTDTVSGQSRICGTGFGDWYVFLNFNRGFPFVEAQNAAAYWSSRSGLNPSIADDRWHHVAGVIDRTRATIRVYVDGAVVASDARSAKDAGAADTFGDSNARYDFYVGSQSTNPNLAFGGTIDEVLIYTRALDAAEIATIARR
jgi:arabinan endo-1,5-alpha-L-arabinosidase